MRKPRDAGGTAAEYALIAAWIGAVIVIAVATLGRTVLGLFQAGLEKFP
jgi:Flp pilus assembly pilin Flp